MAISEFSKIASIGGGLIMNIVKAVGILAFSVGLFFLVKWIQKGTKKSKSFTIIVDIVDMNGVTDIDKLGFMKSDETNLLEMQFQKRKQDSIPPIPKHLIKNNHVMLLNYAPGHYAVIDTYLTIKNFEKGINDYVLVSLGMKKYLMSKQREILNKSEEKKRKWEARAPWITLSIAILAAVLLAAFLVYVGSKLDAENIAQRFLECKASGWQ
jgi:hypothetical protein